MKPKLKPLDHQVIVITGGSSGIGLTTARRAAERGAKLVLAARNDEALREISQELQALGTEVEYVTADVGERDDVRRIARTAVDRFGGFDTWVNDAGAAVYATLVNTPVEDMRKVFETNFWGTVYGSLEAVEHFRAREGGGKLINLGSVLSDMVVPEQGIYATSKHAVKGFTNCLRMELIAERAPVSVTLIKPSGIATPYQDHAKNFMDKPARIPPPLYAPELVADAILYAAQNEARDITVGFAGRGMAITQKILPDLFDRFYAAVSKPLQVDERPGEKIEREGNLHEPMPDGRERSDARFVRNFSLYTAAQTHPRTAAALAMAAGLSIAGAIANRRR